MTRQHKYANLWLVVVTVCCYYFLVLQPVVDISTNKTICVKNGENTKTIWIYKQFEQFILNIITTIIIIIIIISLTSVFHAKLHAEHGLDGLTSVFHAKLHAEHGLDGYSQNLEVCWAQFLWPNAHPDANRPYLLSNQWGFLNK